MSIKNCSFKLCYQKFRKDVNQCVPNLLHHNVLQRCLISSSSCHHVSDRQLFELSKKGDYEGKVGGKKQTTWKNIKLGMLELRTEVKKWQDEVSETIESDPIFVRPGDTDRIFDFKLAEDLDRWNVTSDSDFHEGFSHGSLTLSPTGHGLFSGVIDLRVPKDGKVTKAGYSNITSKYLRKSFKRESYYNWQAYSHLVLRVRGDGRRYFLVLNTSGEYDITWNDRFTYILYTRGGPYWQTVKIPFSKFLLTSKGRVQDKQFPIPLGRIKTFGITCSDQISNSFRLEIDCISLHFDNTHTEEFAYEMYRVPPYVTL